MKVMILLFFLILSSCSSRQPKLLNANNLPTGLILIDKSIMTQTTKPQKCISLSKSIANEQPIYGSVSSYYPYIINITDLINLNSKFKYCENSELKISQIKNQFFTGDKGYFNNPYAYYTVKSDIDIISTCDNYNIKMSSKKREQFKRKENFTPEERELLVLSLTYLSFTLALDDIYHQLKYKDCL